MARLIDADELKNVLKVRHEQLEGEYGSLQGAVSGFIKLLDIQPTVDAAPVRRGKWVEDSTYENIYECSECAEKFILIDGTPEQNSYNFCPNCGAKMQEESENG